MKLDFKQSLLEILSESQILIDEKMSGHTTFRVGGPAQFYVQPEAGQVADIVRLCVQQDMTYVVIGNGSNLLVGDKGIQGVVIEIGKNMSQISIEGNCIFAQAGALLSKVVHAAADEGLTGMEFASGIPGCMGGGTVMNAGAYGGELRQIITKVHCVDKEGNEICLSNRECAFDYRYSIIPEKGYIVTAVELVLENGNKEEIFQTMKQLNQQRAAKQPLEYPSAGSTFKRPTGYFAGKLIMDAGLSGFQIGGAQVSEKHCGFVINRGEATAEDICRLMEAVQEKVQQQFGVLLEPEIRFLGEF